MPILDAGFVTGGAFGPAPAVDMVTGEVDVDLLTAGQALTVTYNLAADTAACQNAANSSATITRSLPILVDLNGGCQNVYVLHVDPVSGSFDPATATYQWQNEQGPVAGGDEQSLNVPAPGTYTVTVTYNGCQVTSDPFVVASTACQIQRGISANNDNFNDTFDLTGFDVKHLTIFNRLGMKVYSRGNYINEWDGKSDDGDELPDGTYFYVIERNTGGDLTGWVYINRAQ
jgi:gliding motility-associated-like protein